MAPWHADLLGAMPAPTPGLVGRRVDTYCGDAKNVLIGMGGANFMGRCSLERMEHNQRGLKVIGEAVMAGSSDAAY